MEDFHGKGKQLLLEGKCEDAIIAFNNAISNNQEIGWSYYNLSKAYLGLVAEAQQKQIPISKCSGLLDKAFVAAKKASKEIGKNNIWVWLQLANIHAWQKSAAKFHACVKEVLRLDQKDNSWVYSALAGAYQKLGDLDNAEKYCKEALKLAKDNSEATFVSCQILCDKGNTYMGSLTAKAISYYDEAIELNPNFGLAWNRKGDALLKLGKLDEALACYEKGLNIDPHNIAAWINKGYILLQLDKVNEAIHCYDKVIKIDPESVDAWYNAGVAYSKWGYEERAILCFDKALEFQPNCIKAIIGKGVSYFDLENYTEALNILSMH